MAYLLEVDDLHTFFKHKKGIVKSGQRCFPIE